MKRFAAICLILLLVLSLSACDVDWSRFDLTKHNFGLTEEESTPDKEPLIYASSTDFAQADFSDDAANYIVPENSSTTYDEWTVVAPEEFRAMAMEKLLDISGYAADLIGLKSSFSDYSSVTRIASEESFLRALNNIRAWNHGAKCYPTEEISEEDIKILEAFILLGTDASEYGAKFPAFVFTDNTESMAEYENLIVSQIVSLSTLLEKE